MRRTILLVTSCVIGLSSAGFASEVITAPRAIIGPRLCVKLSRPDASYSTFMYDRNDCLESTSKQVRDHVWLTGINIRYNVPAFVGCMTAKGYALNSNGYRAIVYQVDAEGHLWGLSLNESCSPTVK
jgi:hypothetical protein